MASPGPKNGSKSLFVNMATSYTREWIRFFTGCGIPNDVATMYALIFYENRIQKNMLLDLNKEYLRDMGITVMGDVIAILRHAKIIHEKYVREQILQVEGEVIVEENSAVVESSPGIKKSTPMKRMLEHYVRKYNSSEIDSVEEVQVILPNEKHVPEKTEIKRPLKKKIEIKMNDSSLKEKGLEVPVPKVRRVLPENEGGYKIKMPSGTTERSKKLLEQAKKRKAKTVFDRLGESSVSSTTSEISTAPSSVSSREKNPSVFARLGEKTSAVSSTSSVDDSETVPQDQLTYAGILKSPTQKKSLSNTTMRADEQQQSEVSKLNLRRGISVKNRLGMTKTEAQGEAVNKPQVQKKSDLFKLSNKINLAKAGAKANGGVAVSKQFKVDSTQAAVSTTTQVQHPAVRPLKRKLEANSDMNSSKKVRFGRTTHRLIPSSPNPTDTSFVKNYPKLTMIINNRMKAVDKGPLGAGAKVGSLNSDKVRERIGVKDRIGNKSVQGRLGERIGSGQAAGAAPGRRISKIKDRLG